MDISFKDKMTNNMLNFCKEHLSLMEKEYLYSHEMWKKAKETKVKLPHVNENGVNVVHGCNMVIDRMERYWLVRRDATVDFLSKEFIEVNDVNRIIRHI
jgi:hypothetical protein